MHVVFLMLTERVSEEWRVPVHRERERDVLALAGLVSDLIERLEAGNLNTKVGMWMSRKSDCF